MEKKIVEEAIKVINSEHHEAYKSVMVCVMTHGGAVKNYCSGVDGDILLMSEIVSETIKLKCLGIVDRAGTRPDSEKEAAQ